MNSPKAFCISKQVVWQAFRQVKANAGSSGVDQETIEDFERDLQNNLTKLWNRMSSGSYFPPPVLRVDIPKGEGKTRPLGIPTVSDRVAQMAVKLVLEPRIEPYFHPDSYGYRPGKSAHDALTKTEERCQQYDYVLDLDIQGFFDHLDHELLLRALRKHTQESWIILYVNRWLKAPVQLADGTQLERTEGTPQGGVISPLLANLFLHYAFDEWMRRHYPDVEFERYADDIVVHCRGRHEAQTLLKVIGNRLKACQLTLHPEKTRIAFCRDGKRRGNWPCVTFNFLGYRFGPQKMRDRQGEFFMVFTLSASPSSEKKMRQKMREWQLKSQLHRELEQLARQYNPILQGWGNYYGYFSHWHLWKTWQYLDDLLIRWAMRKYKKFKGRFRAAKQWLHRIRRRHPTLFVHWRYRLLNQMT